MSDIVLLRPDKAGDLLKTLPALRALLQTCPETPIHLIVSKANDSLLQYESGITFSTLPNQWEKLSNDVLKAELSTRLKEKTFHTAINLLSDSFSEVERLLSVIPAEEKFSVFSETLPSGVWPLTFKNRTPTGKSESLNIAELISQVLGVDLQATTEKMDRAPKLSQADFEEVQKTLGSKNGPWLAICPFAGTQQRSHPLKKWKLFIKHILRKSLYKKVLLFGAPSDSTSLSEIQRDLSTPNELISVFPSSFRTLGAFLKTCDRVVAVDSGPLHMSLALGVPSLGFLSGGDRTRWFNQISPKDKIVARGVFDRYPSVLEMVWHFSRWS